jgi:transcriptional regulator with XRE-family HTH domain
MINILCSAKRVLEIYQVANWLSSWDISNMPRQTAKRISASERAKAIYDRLAELPRPENMSNNEWATRAGVNTSFFTNLRKGSEPSVGNLRSVLAVIGVSLPEFFCEEAEGRLILMPNEEALVQALQDSLPGLPRRPERRAEYLAEVVLRVLELPPAHLAKATIQDSGGPAAGQTDFQVRAATS